MHWWKDQPDLLAGRDLVAGGTWLGLHRNGAFAAVTNFRRPVEFREEAKSRGRLVTRFLESAGDTDSFEAFLAREHRSYNPFNLVYGSTAGLYTWGYEDPVAVRLKQGIHSISNGPMDNHWPKMSLGVRELSYRVHQKSSLTPEALLPVMLDTTPAADRDLPDTGYDLARERLLSPIYIRGADYGTRTTTILLFRRGAVEIAEYQHDMGSSAVDSSRFHVITNDVGNGPGEAPFRDFADA
mgnify:CR=1 FL=1